MAWLAAPTAANRAPTPPSPELFRLAGPLNSAVDPRNQ